MRGPLLGLGSAQVVIGTLSGAVIAWWIDVQLALAVLLFHDLAAVPFVVMIPFPVADASVIGPLLVALVSSRLTSHLLYCRLTLKS